MRTRFLRGDSAQNNGLTLPAGEVSVDTEKKAVRLHDGQTLGGFEIIGTRAVEPAATLIAGDATAGFYGELSGSDFISYGDLSAQVGLSAGTLQYDAESAWLKFALDNKTLYVAKSPCRNNLSWEQLYQAGLVYGVDGFGSNSSGGSVDQGTVITIAGIDYRVRLLRGAAADPIGSNNGGYDVPDTHGSEWNRLFYPIHSGVHTNAQNPNPHSDPNADPFAAWASYSETDLKVIDNHYTWVQETNSTFRWVRGGNGVTISFRQSPTYSNNYYMWRPVLELIE